MSRQDTFDEAVRLWGSFWRFTPNQAEIDALNEACSKWPDVSHILSAVRHATTALDERPTVAWIMAEARRRRPDRVTVTNTLCPECLDEGWKTETGPDGRPALRPCPECRPLQAELWLSGAYKTDAPPLTPRGEGNPAAQAIVDRYRTGDAPKGKRVMVAREPAMTEASREHFQSLARANALVGNARRARFEYLRRLALGARVELPRMPVGDEEAVHLAVALLRARSVEVDQAIIDVPTPEQVLHGARIVPPPASLVPRERGGGDPYPTTNPRTSM